MNRDQQTLLIGLLGALACILVLILVAQCPSHEGVKGRAVGRGFLRSIEGLVVP